jgi:Domain of unknown function (DUF3854)
MTEKTAPTQSSSGQFSGECPELLQPHRDLLHASGISDEVIKERGYESVFGKKRLIDASFSLAQQRPTGILIPLFAPDGSPAGWQYRPDTPRIKDGKPLKYETPSGANIRLDVPPRCRPSLGNPSIDLWVTEGIKKGDALASHGLCAAAMLGVWGFKGKNNDGGITFLADFDNIALKGRRVVIAFDSDVSVKPEVKKAMERLGEHLRRKGANPHVVFLTQDGVNKVGVDDYLLTHSIEELQKLIEPLQTIIEAKINEVFVPGFILRDGTIGEVVIDGAMDERSFVIRGPSGARSNVSDFPMGNTDYKPMNDGLAGHTVVFASAVSAYASLGDLLAEVRAFIHRYVELPSNFEAIASLYILLSWVYDPLPTLPYLRALGDYGSGKTRFLDVTGAIVFRAIRAAGATSPSPIFRIIDMYGGSLVLDEADFARSDAISEIVKILNSGYKPGSPVLRSEPTNSKNWEPHSYNVFGPKILATRKRWTDRALESRCLTWESEGLTREDIPLVLGPRFRSEAAVLRCKLLGFRLDYLPKVLNFNLEDARPVGNLEPRLQEILLPLKAIAEGDSTLEATLDEFIKGMQEEIMEDRRNSLQALTLETILSIRKEDGELSAKEISERLNQGDLIKEHLDRLEQTISPRRVAAVIKNFGLKTRQDATSRRAIVQWDVHRMAVLCRRYGSSIPVNNASNPSNEADILRKHPSGQEVDPSNASQLSDTKNGKNEASEGCEGSFSRIENQPNEHYELILGMAVSEVLKIWASEGKPVIYLGPGESCSGIDKLISEPGVQGRHLKAIRKWLDKVIKNDGDN